jgi:sec-independent protein translocase protein TatA
MNLSLVLAGILGPTEIILIVLVVVLMFGGKKIPELMRGLGKGIREFKDASKGQQEEANNTNAPEKKE